MMAENVLDARHGEMLLGAEDGEKTCSKLAEETDREEQTHAGAARRGCVWRGCGAGWRRAPGWSGLSFRSGMELQKEMECDDVEADESR